MAGEIVLDVPPTLSARTRLLDSGSSDKTPPHDARAAAVAALRHPRQRIVAADDHVAVLRLLGKRHHDLTALRTEAVGPLRTVLCLLTPGALPVRLNGAKGSGELRKLRPAGAAATERRRLATELVADVRHWDNELSAVRVRSVASVAASATPVLNVYGVGPIVAGETVREDKRDDSGVQRGRLHIRRPALRT